MTMGEIVEAIENISEDSVKKLKIASWLSVELGRIVNRRAYFWRKAAFSLDSVAATPTYNLSDTGTSPLDIAPDFLQFATPLIEFDSSNAKIGEVPFASSQIEVLQMVRDTTVGPPTLMTIEPGTVKTIRLSPIPDGVHHYSAMYYREAVINFKTPNWDQDEVPIIPAAFHYVLYQAMERRAFFYLYGQKDPRAVLAAQAETQCLADLDSYRSGSTLASVEWRSSDESAFVRSTS